MILVVTCAVPGFLSLPANATRSKFYLERFALADLTINQIVIEKHHRFARVGDPSGMLVSVEVGDYIDDQDGKIVSIEKCGIRIVEIRWTQDKQPYEFNRFWPVSAPGSESGCSKDGPVATKAAR